MLFSVVGRQRIELWTDFAKLILAAAYEALPLTKRCRLRSVAAYEASLLAAVINASRTGVNTVHLTLLGGGLFGNDDVWILGAIEGAFLKTKPHGLDIRIISFRQPKAGVAGLIQRINET